MDLFLAIIIIEQGERTVVGDVCEEEAVIGDEKRMDGFEKVFFGCGMLEDDVHMTGEELFELVHT